MSVQRALLALKSEAPDADSWGMNLSQLKKDLLPWAVAWTIYIVLVLWLMIGPLPAGL